MRHREEKSERSTSDAGEAEPEADVGAQAGVLGGAVVVPVPVERLPGVDRRAPRVGARAGRRLDGEGHEASGADAPAADRADPGERRATRAGGRGRGGQVGLVVPDRGGERRTVRDRQGPDAVRDDDDGVLVPAALGQRLVPGERATLDVAQREALSDHVVGPGRHDDVRLREAAGGLLPDLERALLLERGALAHAGQRGAQPRLCRTVEAHESRCVLVEPTGGRLGREGDPVLTAGDLVVRRRGTERGRTARLGRHRDERRGGRRQRNSATSGRDLPGRGGRCGRDARRPRGGHLGGRGRGHEDQTADQRRNGQTTVAHRENLPGSVLDATGERKPLG